MFKDCYILFICLSSKNFPLFHLPFFLRISFKIWYLLFHCFQAKFFGNFISVSHRFVFVIEPLYRMFEIGDVIFPFVVWVHINWLKQVISCFFRMVFEFRDLDFISQSKFNQSFLSDLFQMFIGLNHLIFIFFVLMIFSAQFLRAGCVYLISFKIGWFWASSNIYFQFSWYFHPFRFNFSFDSFFHFDHFFLSISVLSLGIHFLLWIFSQSYPQFILSFKMRILDPRSKYFPPLLGFSFRLIFLVF